MGQPLETVKIAWECDLGYLTINKIDFDPSIHSLWKSKEQFINIDGSIEKRKAELESQSWHEWKRLAAELDPPITEKPEGGWDEVIPLILEAEYGR